MVFLNRLDQIRSVEWGRKHLWDIKFDDSSLPKPFDSWFPAVDIDEDRANVGSFQFSAFLNTFKIPASSVQKELKITFVDDERNTIADWLDHWINVIILNNGNHVATVDEAAKAVQIVKLAPDKITIYESMHYWIIPADTNASYNGNSSSDAQIYTVPFVIVGEDGQKRTF